MTIAPGTRLGAYEVLSAIGAGGMGEVYRAHDSKLGRDVAIKILPPTFATDPDRRARFEREARILASLNHPHIGAIYGLEDAGDVRALVLELIEGETLAHRLQHGRIPVVEALSIAQQIADALEAAHDRGIVHRDLKPGNVKITQTGTVKVLDFGLAKATGSHLAGTADSHLPTVSSGGTRESVILGTAAYMSPEQARGQQVDKRTDIWAFGCVLYEMLTGRLAFPGGTFSDTIVSILEHDPDWTALPATTPVIVRQLLARSLEKSQKDRMRDVGDIRIELRQALAPGEPKTVGDKREWRLTSRWIWGGLALAGAALLTSRIDELRAPLPAAVPVRLNLAFEGLTGEAGTPVPSPDGKNFVFQAFEASGRRSLWLRPIDSESARPLQGTDDAEQPFWFPDGRWIGFFAQGKLRRISASGGAPQTIADVPGTAGGFASGAAVNGQGDIIFSPANRSPLFRVRPDGSFLQLTQLDSTRAENSHRYPSFLPDGRRFLFLARSGRRENNALYLGTLESAETRRLITVHSNVVYVPPRPGRQGTLLYVRDGTLVEQQFDGENVVGEPHEIVENVEYVAPSLLAKFAASSDGTVLIFRPAGSGRFQLRWFDRQGHALATLSARGEYIQPRISPDGTGVLVSRPDAQSGNRDIWLLETSRGVAARLTTDAANDWWPVWSPDGRGLLFATDRDGGPRLTSYRKTSMDLGKGENRLLNDDASETQLLPEDWSHDGNWVSLASGGTTEDDLWVLPTSGDQKPFAFLATPFIENSSRFSADGRWIAYTSNETGRFEVFVRPFAGRPSTPEGKIQVSTAGADFPVWRRDGGELFFIGSDLKLYAVQTSDFGQATTSPKPQALFTMCQDTVLAGLPMRTTPWDHPYDVSRDGQQFLINCLALNPGRFDVMLNWTRPFK